VSRPPPQRVRLELGEPALRAELDRLLDLVVEAAGDVAAGGQVVDGAEAVPRHQGVVVLDHAEQRDAPQPAASVVGVLGHDAPAVLVR